MARRKPNSSKSAAWRPRLLDSLDSGFVQEIAAFVLLGLGGLLFLALVSYDPGDLPDWLFFSHKAPPNSPEANFVGYIGAILAGLCYSFIGASAYLLAALLLAFGCLKIFYDDFRIRTRLLWAILAVISAACLLDGQKLFLLDWPLRYNIVSPGGWFGSIIGGQILRRLVGPLGAMLVLAALYAVSIVMITGIRPLTLLRSLRSLPSALWHYRHQRRIERATSDQELLELESELLRREQKKLEKTLRKGGRRIQRTPAPGDDSASDLFSDEENLITEPRPVTPRSRNRPAPPAEPAPLAEDIPEPAIVDNSQPKKRGKPTQRELAAEETELQMDVMGNPLMFTESAIGSYALPTLALLRDYSASDVEDQTDEEELKKIRATVISTLGQFGIPVSPGIITKGPTITRYEVLPAEGVRVDKILALERDIARATKAERINILAPIPGKDTVGIEIANAKKTLVSLRELFESDEWEACSDGLPLALGKDVYGKTLVADLTKMPHLLVAGTTGSGKSVCINTIIASLLFRYSPDELRFIMVDPKVVELQMFNRLPHLAVPVVTDPKKVLLALRWVIDEMEHRYHLFAKSAVRNIKGYNALAKETAPPEPLDSLAATLEGDLPPSENSASPDPASPAPPRPEPSPAADPADEIKKLPYIVVIIDELADLMQTAPADVEAAIARITQMARAAGIHMIVATQTPRADVITGIIKANIPSRIAFQVASKLDSRVILDTNGAERLLGQGDMLYLPPGTSRMVRAQGALLSEEEMSDIVDFIATQSPAAYDPAAHQRIEGLGPPDDVTEEEEEIIEKCLDIFRQEKKASTSMIQRRLRLGYNRAARVMDIMERRGIIAAGEGARPREILVDLDT